MGRQVVHEFFHDAMVRGMRIKDRRNCSLTGRKLGHGRKGKPNSCPPAGVIEIALSKMRQTIPPASREPHQQE